MSKVWTTALEINEIIVPLKFELIQVSRITGNKIWGLKQNGSTGNCTHVMKIISHIFLSFSTK